MSTRPSRTQYARVDAGSNVTGGDGSPSTGNQQVESNRMDRRRKRSALAEDYAVKMHAALWVIGALVVGYFSEFIDVCRNSEDVNRFWFNVGLVLFVVATCLVLYMAIYVPRVLKCNLDPSVYSPKLLPMTAIISVLSGLFLIIGLWPVYHLFTPALLGLFWIGSLMSAHFLPAM